MRQLGRDDVRTMDLSAGTLGCGEQVQEVACNQRAVFGNVEPRRIFPDIREKIRESNRGLSGCRGASWKLGWNCLEVQQSSRRAFGDRSTRQDTTDDVGFG